MDKNSKKANVASKMKEDSLARAIAERREMIKRGDVFELLNYGAMRRKQKGGQ